jgi:hypothetical protein
MGPLNFIASRGGVFRHPPPERAAARCVPAFFASGVALASSWKRVRGACPTFSDFVNMESTGQFNKRNGSYSD